MSDIGNTLNNNADNLEWTSGSENIRHSYDSGLNNKTRAILQFSLSNEFLAEFQSIAAASRATGVAEHKIRDCANKRDVKNLNCVFRFKNEDETALFSRKYSLK